jgi:hypothetical protein
MERRLLVFSSFAIPVYQSNYKFFIAELRKSSCDFVYNRVEKGHTFARSRLLVQEIEGCIAQLRASEI